MTNIFPLLERMFAIVGHPPEEQKSLADDFMRSVIQKAVVLLIPKLNSDTRLAFEDVMAQGKGPEEVLRFLSSKVEEKLLEESIAGSSFVCMQSYVKRMEPHLTKKQKEDLFELFYNVA